MFDSRRLAPRRLLLLCAALLTAAWASAPDLAAAQDDEIVTDDIQALAAEAAAAAAAEDAERAEGWDYGLSLGATFSLLHSRKVVGAFEGTTVQLGLILDGYAVLREGDHEWRSALILEHGQTKAPQYEDFLKTTDNLELRSLYLYRLLPWLGPFARVRINTQVAPGYEVRAEDVFIQRTRSDGEVIESAAAAQTKIEMTAPFEPLLLVESAGALVTVVDRPVARVDVKLGLGGQHIFVGDDAYALNDDDETAVLEFVQIEDSHSLGSELELEGSGQIADNIGWTVLANLFYPFITSYDGEVEGLDALHIDIGAGLSVKLAEWISLDYTLNARRLPFILDEWQVQNLVLVTAGFNLF